jgi:SAM-dependent methyltransferase
LLPPPAKASLSSVTSLGIGNGDAEPLSTYWRFYRAVAAAQLSRWLPRSPARVLDVSGPRARCAVRAAAAGHTVIQLRTRPDGPTADAAPGAKPGKGRVHPVVADADRLGFLPAGSMDAVIAEDRVLSRQLVTEETVAEIARVLRPGGRMLMCVDSLVLGMAILAEQNYWAHLSDVPRAEVVLVPWPNGIITRCFWVDELRQLLLEADLEVEWIRPRTALSPSTVEHVLSAAPGELPRLVRTELATPIGAESVGIHLVASAIKRD